MRLKIFSFGINDYPDAPLRGCVQDSNDMLAWAKARGADPKDRLQLLNREATGEGIDQGIQWLIKDPVPYEDVLALHMSCHGTQIRDTDGDEHDKLDESIVPFDFAWANPETYYTDDRLSRALQYLPVGVNLTIIADMCHAGTLLRARPGMAIHSPLTQSRVKSLPIRSELIRDALLAEAKTGWRSWFGFTPPVRPLGRSLTQSAILLPATKPRQLAADAVIGGIPRGAHTFALLRALQVQPAASYAHTVAEMRGWLDQNGYGGVEGQTPGLEGYRAARRLPAFQPFPRLA